MTFDKATYRAVGRLTERVDLLELRKAAQDLRTLAPNSVLAQLAEEKIERLLHDCSGCGFEEAS